MEKLLFTRLVLSAVSCLTVLSLAGCGGGGGGDPAATVDTPNSVGGAVPPVVIATPSEVVVPPTSPASTPTTPVEPVVLPVPAVDKSVQKQQQRIGVNVAAVTYYSRTNEYVDLVQQSNGFGLTDQPWIADPATVGRTAVPIGADGWPAGDFGIILFSAQKFTPGMGGTYTVVFRGTAKLSLTASSGYITNQRTDPATGLTLADVVFPEGGNQLIINFKETNGGVKDLRVIRPGYTWNDPNLPVYTKEFLAQLEPFSTLRFMDWTGTNGMADGNWDKRPTLTNARAGYMPRGGTAGLPWEKAIHLANTTGSDIWINVPTQADARYYTELAKLLKAQLAPNIKIYVEYSNEMWNYFFPQYNWSKTTGVQEEIAAGNTKINADGETKPDMLAMRLFAERTFRISAAFRSVFGDAEMMTRVRPVLAWQAGGSYYVDYMLKYASSVFTMKPVSHYIYGIAGAPYLNLGAQQTVDGLTTAQVLDALDAATAKSSSTYRYEHNAYLAKRYGVQWLAYEGGPDTFGDGSLASKAAAGRDPRFLNTCKQYLNEWSGAGGGLFMWFHSGAGAWDTKYGSWTLQEFMKDPVATNPKMACMVWASMTTPPVATSRHAPGVEFDAGEVAGQFLTNQYAIERNWYQLDQARDFVVSSPTKTCYKLSATSAFSNDKAQFDVYINGNKQFTSPALPYSATNTLTSNVWGQVCLDAGINVMTVKMSQVSGGALGKFLISPL